MEDERALVLGGGGLAGTAWATGVVAGLAEEGTDVRDAGFVLGTSAGAVAGAQITSGTDLPALLRAQADPDLQPREPRPREGALAEILAYGEELNAELADPLQRLRRMGELALTADTVAEDERRRVIAARLPSHAWPAGPLSLVAVNAATGETKLFDRSSGADLVDAVAASCAIPGVWPAATVDGAGYFDGAVRSMANLDLAVGHRRILVLAPLPDPVLDADTAAGTARGDRIEVVTPDEDALAAFGPDPLDPAARGPAARAGLVQGRAAAPAVAALWDGR